MKNVTVPIVVGLIALVMVLYLVAFQVRETESAFVTTFGKPGKSISKPGLYFKLPDPIQRVQKYDCRMRVLEADVGETTTRGAVPIIINTYIVWKIGDPVLFRNGVRSVEKAETLLLSQINDTQNRVIGQHDFGEFVNSDPAKVQINAIQTQMLDDLRNQIRQGYGGAIEVGTLGIKQLKVSKDSTKEVFERMKADRKRKTDNTISEGISEATRIRSDAEAKRKVLLAAAEGRAKEIQGKGDAEAAGYYKMLEEDRELANLLRDLEALRNILKDRSTLVLPAEGVPLELLRKMPSLGSEAAGGAKAR